MTCLGYDVVRSEGFRHDKTRQSASVPPSRALGLPASIPALIAEHFILSGAGGSRTELGGLQMLDSAFSSTSAASLPVLWDACVAICHSLSTFRYQAQTLVRRREALQLYSSTISAIRHVLQVYGGSDLPLTTAVLLLAIFELSVECNEHDTAWRYHLQGVQGLAVSLCPAREVRYSRPSCAFRNVIFDLRELAPAMDVFSDSKQSPRKLDVRKLRVDVQTAHKHLLVLKNSHARGYASTDTTSGNAAFAWRLCVLTGLLLTIRFLVETDHYLQSSRYGFNPHSKLETKYHKLRAEIVSDIIQTAALLLTHGASADLTELLSLQLHSQPESPSSRSIPTTPSNHTSTTPTLISALTASHSLSLVLSNLDPNSPQHHLIRELLLQLGSTSFVPKAFTFASASAFAPAQIANFSSPPRPSHYYTEALNGLCVLAMGLALS